MTTTTVGGTVGQTGGQVGTCGCVALDASVGLEALSALEGVGGVVPEEDLMAVDLVPGWTTVVGRLAEVEAVRDGSGRSGLSLAEAQTSISKDVG